MMYISNAHSIKPFINTVEVSNGMMHTMELLHNTIHV